MAETRKFFRRKSLFTMLFIVVVLLASLAVAAALGGWWLLQNVRDSQQRLSQLNIPLITAAQSLATQSASIALLAPQIPNIGNTENLEVLYRQLERHLNFMDSIPVRIRQLKGSEDLDISNSVGEIRRRFKEINDVVVRKLQTRQVRDREIALIRSTLAGVLNSLERAIAAQSEAIFARAEQMNPNSTKAADLATLDRLVRTNLDIEVLFDLNRHSTELDGLLQRLAANSDLNALRDIESRADFELRLIVSESIGIALADTSQSLAPKLNELYRRLNTSDNAFVLQQRLNLIELEMDENYGFLRDAVHRLNLKTKNLVNQVEIDTRLASSKAIRTAQLSTDMSLLIAVLSLVISAITIWFFIIRRVIRPLRELAGNLRDISQKRLDFDVDSYSMFELNEMAFAIGVFRDNSAALAEHQNRLQENNEQLSRVNHDLNAFVHVASHDLKSPLHGIRVLSDFIIGDLKTGNHDLLSANLDLLQQRISRMETLIDALLGFTQAGSLAVEYNRVNTRQIIQEAFDLVSTQPDFTLKLPAQLPDCEAVESDLMILFMNLFDNAITHHDRDWGRIEVIYGENESNYIFEVNDDGPGIDHAYHELVFEVLQTLKSRDQVEGSGVGLAHVRRLLESRGGSIEVISNPQLQRGSRFICRYPKPVSNHAE